MTKKITVFEEAAKQIEVRVLGIDNYKEALLAIFNNVRTDSRLYSVENNSVSSIFVTCKSSEVQDTADWLSQWGKILGVYDVLVYKVDSLDLDYDLNKYDDCCIVFD